MMELCTHTQILINAKLKTGKRGQTTELVGESPLTLRRLM